MKKLMLTTALVAVTSMGAIAQTAGSDAEMHNEMGHSTNVPAFLVSNFTGKSLYTLDTDATRGLAEQRAPRTGMQPDVNQLRWESSDTFSADREAWENVGNIDDIVLTKDGEVRGVLIDVGGFLGFGARTVMVDIDDLYFVAEDSEADDVSDFNVLVAMTREQLEELSEWDESQLEMGFESRARIPQASQMDHDTASAQTAMPEGYRVMTADERTADRLMGADVYGPEDDNIATVDDLILDADDAVTEIIMDVGGFLGIGSHTVAISIDSVDVLWSDENGDVRVHIAMTQEELEALPEYEG